MVFIIRVQCSEWCLADLEGPGGAAYTVEKIDIRNLGLKGVRGEKINPLMIVQKFPDVDILVLVECEYDYPHIILVYSKARKAVHYLVSESI